MATHVWFVKLWTFNAMCAMVQIKDGGGGPASDKGRHA